VRSPVRIPLQQKGVSQVTESSECKILVESPGELNGLKEIIVDPFHRIGSVRSHRHIEFDHKFSQP
jgi:hypothetical protein